MTEMTPRQRVLAAVNRQEPDRTPKTASFTPAIMERFRRETGAQSPTEYFGMEPRGIGFVRTQAKTDFRRFFPKELPANATFDEYGRTRVPGTYYHFTKVEYPMAEFTKVSQLESYPWPDMEADYRHAHLEDGVKRLRDAGYFVHGGVAHIFEIAWQLRGMDRLFMDFGENPDFAAFLLDRITSHRRFMAVRYAQAGCDMIHCGDDVGMQDRMMMSPAMWRQWFKPRWKQVWDAAREVNPDIHIFYHSDGYIEPIIGELIEIGLTVLNPVQPECMDPAKLKAQYGDRLAFWGTIGTQTTMPFGSPEEVRETIRQRIETVGKGGGLLLAPTHVLEPEVPWENILAFFDAIEKHGKH